MLEHERRWWEQGVSLLAGVDEAGRGPLAGPVVAATVSGSRDTIERLFTTHWKGLTDSKRLSDSSRRAFFISITGDQDVLFGVGICTPAEIDTLNILRATHTAMARALTALPRLPERALVDGLPVKGLPIQHEAIVGGDGLSLLIAAASVVAKVLRDDAMIELDKAYPQYGFAAHKGYGTPQHIEALRRHGPCPAHRQSFAPVRQMELGMGDGVGDGNG